MMDGSFHAIATMLHRVPRDPADPRGKRKPGTPRQGERDTQAPDIPHGWIRVAL